jgi:hypothetical protein
LPTWVSFAVPTTLEQWGQLQRLHHRRGRRPDLRVVFAPILTQAMENLGYTEAQRRALWGEMERLRAQPGDSKPTVNKRVNRALRGTKPKKS